MKLPPMQKTFYYYKWTPSPCGAVKQARYSAFSISMKKRVSEVTCHGTCVGVSYANGERYTWTNERAVLDGAPTATTSPLLWAPRPSQPQTQMHSFSPISPNCPWLLFSCFIFLAKLQYSINTYVFVVTRLCNLLIFEKIIYFY